MKEAVEGFLYISKRSSASMIISDLPSSHKHWKECYFFIRGLNWEYNSTDREDTLGIPTVWTALENLREFPSVLVGVSFYRLLGVLNFALVVLPSGVCPDLGSEDKEVKWQLAKCLSRVYSKLIRSDIPRPSGVNPSRPPVSSPSLPFVMKPSCEGPSVLKPTREELQARVESLAKKKRSVKRKAQAPPESSLAVRG